MERINCDVFVTNGTIFSSDDAISITGNFCVGNNCTVFAIVDAEGSVFVGDGSYVDSISAKENVSLGDFSESLCIHSGKNISLGNYSSATEITAGEDLILGYDANICSINACEEILIGKKFSLLTLLKKVWLDWNM